MIGLVKEIKIEIENFTHTHTHTQLAEKATKQFKSNGKAEYRLVPNESANLVNCDYFITIILKMKIYLNERL